MLNNMSRTRLVGFWFIALMVATAGIVTVNLELAITMAPLLLTLALAPPAIMLIVWRGPPPPTVAEVLYSVRNAKDGRP